MDAWNIQIIDSLGVFWLPKGSSWDELQEYTQLDLKRMITTCFLLASAIYIIRLLFEKYIGTPIGVYFKVPGRQPFTPNPTLETYYGAEKLINESVLMVSEYLEILK